MKIEWFKLVVSIVMCQTAGIVGSLFTVKNIPAWYAALNKPSFNPPNWIFGPVWIFLYILMGISFYLIWINSGTGNFGLLLSLFIFQLVLNSFWTIIFFGLKSPLFAFCEIAVLWVAILFCIILFFQVSKISSFLLIPYLLWVTFAAILNFAIWKLN
jgi:tryptophan-rich sensory protein